MVVVSSPLGGVGKTTGGRGQMIEAKDGPTPAASHGTAFAPKWCVPLIFFSVSFFSTAIDTLKNARQCCK